MMRLGRLTAVVRPGNDTLSRLNKSLDIKVSHRWQSIVVPAWDGSVPG
jgi:hypothetical protein